jgi:hypothetical protein
MNLKIVCVKWGDKFSALYVNRLYNMVKRNLSLPYRFVCLTDDAEGFIPHIDIIKLQEKFEYCWTKIELFRPGVFSEEDLCLYLDLDVVITDSIDDVVTAQPEKKFVGLYDWYSPRRHPYYNSSVMRFYGNNLTYLYSSLVEKLKRGTVRWKREFDAYLGSNDKVVLWEGEKRYGSDQEWISAHVYPQNEIKAHSFPKKWIRSYKKHGRNRLPKNCKIMVFHGFPKPHEVDNEYVKECWQ